MDKSVCPACGGSGQLSLFRGESRFVLSVEECPHCCGTGRMQDDDVPEEQDKSQRDQPLNKEAV